MFITCSTSLVCIILRVFFIFVCVIAVTTHLYIIFIILPRLLYSINAPLWPHPLSMRRSLLFSLHQLHQINIACTLLHYVRFILTSILHLFGTVIHVHFWPFAHYHWACPLGSHHFTQLKINSYWQSFQIIYGSSHLMCPYNRYCLQGIYASKDNTFAISNMNKYCDCNVH